MLHTAKSLETLISIHAPAKGATISSTTRSASCIDFNPRSREGSDAIAVLNDMGIKISIHAPAKGATLELDKLNSVYKVFQSTLPRRERPDFQDLPINLAQFQSTLPRRERRLTWKRCGWKCNFNPRSREGNDIRFCRRYLHHIHFNPRSREGSD